MAKFAPKVCTMSIDPKNPRIGPELKADATPEQISDKIQQMINAWSIFGYFFNSENLPTFPQYESDIKKTPIAAAIYACCFLKKPWPEAESSIAKCKESSMLYASKLLKGRFPAGEKVISESPEHLLAYSLIVLKRGKLPDFLHRKMIAHAIKDPDNKHIKRYLRFKKVREA